MFDELLESSGKRRAARSGRTLLASLLVHSAVLLTLVALPLIHYRSLPEAQFLTFLGAVSPPLPVLPVPPPVATPKETSNPVRREVAGHTLFRIPTEVPEGIPSPPEELPDFQVGGAGLGAGSGIPGGESGSVGVAFVGTGVPALGPELPPPPPPPSRKNPVRVGGDVQNSRLIRRVDPVYPPLAVRARLQGTVLLHATVGETGEVVDVQVLRGHPLLREAAVEAVRQWIYSPTLLNGEPVEVITEISVHFRLGR